MTSWIGRTLYTVAVILLLHSGYSAFEHLAYLKMVGKTETSLPADIVIECLASVFVATIGVALVSGDLKPISLEKELATMSMDSIDSRPSFRTLHHRGKAIFRPV
ncbi:Membrane magnesium transporter 1 [Geranomyces michiganensis]|nr:Membrane magnesium transporter 1 [Geranomyces michiganensis]